MRGSLYEAETFDDIPGGVLYYSENQDKKQQKRSRDKYWRDIIHIHINSINLNQSILWLSLTSISRWTFYEELKQKLKFVKINRDISEWQGI